MDDSITHALLAHISRLEAELASLRKTVSELAAEGTHLPNSFAANTSPTSVDASEPDKDEATVPTHSSGLEMTKGLFLEEVFRAALIEDEDTRSEKLGALTHSAAMLGPRSVEYLKAFNWKQLVKNVSSYLENGQPGSFQVTRSEPAEPAATKVKIFLKPGDGRHPAPILLERDPAKGGGWKIAQISL